MKRILTILVLIIVCASAFAVDVSLNLGGGAFFNKGKFYLSDSQKNDGYVEEYKVEEYKSILVDVDCGVEVEFDNNLVVYDTVSLGFPGDEVQMKYAGDTEFSKIKIENSFIVSESIGVGYKFHCIGFDFITGAGLKFDIINYNQKEEDLTLVMSNFGAGINLKGSYFFNNHFAAMLAVRPSVTFYDSWIGTDGNTVEKADGAATGFSCTSVIGIEYKF